MLPFPNLSPPDARVASSAFEFMQFLLDDDTNLTPAGNLTGAAKQKCRARLDEIVAADESNSRTAPVAEAAEAP